MTGRRRTAHGTAPAHAARIAGVLRRRIQKRELPPGTEIPVPSITAEFDTTTYVANQVIYILWTEGLVTRRPRYAARVEGEEDPPGHRRLYEVVADRIEGRIEAGQYHPGSWIPLADALAREFSVSETTIHRALRLLREVGALNNVPGQGSYIAGVTPQGHCTQTPEKGADPDLSQKVRHHLEEKGATGARIPLHDIATSLEAPEEAVRASVRELMKAGAIGCTLGAGFYPRSGETG